MSNQASEELAKQSRSERVTMRPTIASVAAAAVIASLLVASQAAAVPCVSRSGKLTLREECRLTERILQPEELGSTGVKAFSGHYDGALGFGGAGTSGLPIPEAGKYFVIAEGLVYNPSSWAAVECELFPGPWDYRPPVPGPIDSIVLGQGFESITMSLVHEFWSPGEVEFHCNTLDTGRISNLRITAIKMDVEDTQLPVWMLN